MSDILKYSDFITYNGVPYLVHIADIVGTDGHLMANEGKGNYTVVSILH